LGNCEKSLLDEKIDTRIPKNDYPQIVHVPDSVQINKHSAVPWALRFQQGSLGIVIWQGVFARVFLPGRFCG
jgi:hypothetical protein